VKKTITRGQLAVMLDLHNRYTQRAEGGEWLDLRDTIVGSANLSYANLQGARMQGADLSGATLRSANLYGADLSNADLQYADLSGANLYSADLSGANLDRVDLRNTNLGEIISDYPIYQVYFGQYHAHVYKGYIRIGCEYRTAEEWLKIDKRMAYYMGLRSELFPMYMQFIMSYHEQWTNQLGGAKTNE